MRWSIAALLCFASAITIAGCRSGARPVATKQPFSAIQPTPSPVQQASFAAQVSVAEEEASESLPVPPITEEEVDKQAEDESQADSPTENADLELLPPALSLPPPTLEDLANSVRLHFPAIQQAIASRTIASGEVLAASGSFDHKLKGFTNSQPLDFYENYRHSLGVERDTFWGGQVFAGYKNGRGIFEPWYLERETNKGGELSASVVVPLVRNRDIDANRAELWRSQIERGRVEPEIQAIIIRAIRDANVAYWQWVATAANYRVAEQVLQLGLDRKGFLERQVELGEKAKIELVDNQRIIVSRSAKLTDARRKLQQSAVKLSLYLRDGSGQPIVLPVEATEAAFPDALSAEAWGLEADIALARATRPELEDLRLAGRQLRVLLRQACNETLPQVDGGLLVGQDFGEPTSSLRDKSEFEVEATLTFSMPLQRRKAFGKVRQLRGKLVQNDAKMRLTADKIAIEAQAAHAALIAAAKRVDQTTEGLTLAQQMQAAEQRLYELGQSTLLMLNLREQQAAEAAVEQVMALYDYHVALAEYAAALGFETIAEIVPVDEEELLQP